MRCCVISYNGTFLAAAAARARRGVKKVPKAEVHDSTMRLPDIITPRLELLGCSQLLSHHRLGLVRWFDVDLLFEPFK